MEWFCWAALDSVASPVGLTSQALIGPAAYAKTLAVSDSFAKKGRLSGIGDHLTMREPAIISCADAASVLPVPPRDASTEPPQSIVRRPVAASDRRLRRRPPGMIVALTAAAPPSP